MPVTVDTTRQQYQTALTVLNGLEAELGPRLRKLVKMGRGQKAAAKLWLQNDPLLRKTLKIGKRLQPYLAQIAEAVDEVDE